MSKTFCKTFWGTKHTFGKWEEKDRHNQIRSDDKSVIAIYMIQQRKCEVCGFIQTHRQEVISI